MILPLLSQGMIQPKTDKKRAGKNRKAIKQAVADLREANSDGGKAVELQSLMEQACNFYLQQGCFPDTYEEMQPIPMLTSGMLPYAGDDGPHMGQAYRMSYDLEHKLLTLALRTPNIQGAWARTWRENTFQMTLPDLVVERAKAGKTLAPSLREIVETDGTRYAVLDFIVEVPVEHISPFEEIQTVLGFDYNLHERQHDAPFLSERLVVHLIPLQVASSRFGGVLERRMASMCMTKDAHFRSAVCL